MSLPLPTRVRDGAARRWEATSLHGRLVGILLVLLLTALAITGFASQFVLRDYLVGQVDDDLLVNGRQTAQQLANDDDFGPRGGPTDYYVRIDLESGVSQALQVPNDVDVESGVPQLPALSAEEAAGQGPAPRTTLARDGSRWRTVVFPATRRGGGALGSVSVSLPMDGIAQTVNRLRILIVLFGLIVTGLCVLLGSMAVRRSFRPLTEVEETAAAIAAGDLSRRVPDHPATTEVGRLTSALNGMLAQIERAFHAREASEARTRRFAADASHELRTPLTTIRGFAELYRQGAVTEPADVSRTMGRIEDESRRMGGLVEDLLLLARLDEQRPTRSDPVDLAVLAGDAVHDARGLAPDRTVRLVGLRPGGGPEPAVVTGDDARLRQVVANLLANAVRHTPPASPIEVAVGREDGLAVLEVRDHGRGIPPEHAPKVFERFYRVDSSRWRGQGGGSGLGLSIVAAVVTAHGGRVGVAETEGGGATFRLELPAGPPAAEEATVDEDADITAR